MTSDVSLPREIEVLIRIRSTLRVGDTIRLKPRGDAIAANEFFNTHNNMKAEILGFDYDDRDIIFKAVSGRWPRPRRITRAFVRFENGEEPPHSIDLMHFIKED